MVEVWMAPPHITNQRLSCFAAAEESYGSFMRQRFAQRQRLAYKHIGFARMPGVATGTVVYQGGDFAGGLSGGALA